jgi:hypothetical protein
LIVKTIGGSRPETERWAGAVGHRPTTIHIGHSLAKVECPAPVAGIPPDVSGRVTMAIRPPGMPVADQPVP